MNIRYSRRGLSVAALALFVALSAAACGGKDDNASNTNAAHNTNAAAPTPKPATPTPTPVSASVDRVEHAGQSLTVRNRFSCDRTGRPHTTSTAPRSTLRSPPRSQFRRHARSSASRGGVA